MVENAKSSPARLTNQEPKPASSRDASSATDTNA
jgi:hypothetical protein